MDHPASVKSVWVNRMSIWILVCGVGGFSQHNARAQPSVDASLHADWLQESDVWGMGGAVHLVFAQYAVEFVPSGSYYFAADDSTESWAWGLDMRIHLPRLGPVRPFAGAGTVNLRRDNDPKWLLNLSGGVHLRIRGDRIIPFIEGAYRPSDSVNPWRFRSGLRFILSEQ